ncbi:hypothetical protein TanjilG_20493 [Lupinus angustifolius]|uniref:Uncharacterized protein n=2 Tax=Lupinus angustifolius TaxID=3871 RepID=A0A1J7IAJ1_LUPAN|nr:PREDICTED: uncharacterized protein LOC109349961 isoform X2 [Lupinus angustifolius]XP_019446588.1 PREDICTED: uncharacterized protein LOC109349961 isoform X2 [Lupinus angustifolius]OIW09867.1 hypothetical protein TanjilG_20493 [Lupinus angustifolius]
MGQELELDHHGKSLVGLSPNTVLSSDQYCANVKKRSKKGKPAGKDDFLTLKGNFAEINFSRFRSSSCKSHLSRPNGLEIGGNLETRRASVYQSSEVVDNIKKLSSMGGRQKIEISRTSDIDTSFSGSIVASLCGSDDERFGQRSSEISRDSNLDSPSVSMSMACMEPNSPNGFIDFCMNSHVRDRDFTAVKGRDSINVKFRNDNVVDSLIDGNSPVEKDIVHPLQKSFSAKVDASHLQSPSENDCSSRATPKSRFNPVSRRRLNQFAKSKSLRSPVGHKVEPDEVKSNETVNITRSRTYQKSLLTDLSNAAKHSDIISEFINREIQYSGIASSPVHLHANMKLENKHGVPCFEFKVKCPEDVFVAKASRAGDAFNWVYTFDSVDNRKRSNASDLGSHHFDKDSSAVAQMLVSCKLCSELEGSISDNNSMVTEFVLYDLTHLRQTVSSEKRSFSEQDTSKTLKAFRTGLKEKTFRPDEGNLAVKNKVQVKPVSSNVEFGHSDSYPLLSSELNSNLETAAIVLEIPFVKRESLKYKRGDRISAKEYSDIIELPTVLDRRRKSLRDSKIQERMKVVIPTGNHGLPTVESRGPSSLLERLRHGGGCDCGGWDMACPLILLGNPSIEFAEDHPLMEDYQPLELFIQGAKDSNPTFSMKIIEQGQYAVDFHAQLSTLQAFSICVAILHGTSAFNVSGHEKNQQLSQCSSLKMLTKDEVELLIKSVTIEENKTVSKTPKRFPQSYVLNPPFSPIARV